MVLVELSVRARRACVLKLVRVVLVVDGLYSASKTMCLGVRWSEM